MNIEQAKKIMGKNFIGPEELSAISSKLGIADPIKSKMRVPEITFPKTTLEREKKNAVLILGISKDKNGKSITINSMRARFGIDPKKSEPCFYNQDWYVKEKFASKDSLKLGWYLVSKKVAKESKGKNPDVVKKNIQRGQTFPSAVLCAYTFFAYYFHTKANILWMHDFIWCSDHDNNGDQIYVGRYKDPKVVNKNGFNIHRRLAISNIYGLAPRYSK